jgi:hypothetical protein
VHGFKELSMENIRAYSIPQRTHISFKEWLMGMVLWGFFGASKLNSSKQILLAPPSWYRWCYVLFGSLPSSYVWWLLAAHI